MGTRRLIHFTVHHGRSSLPVYLHWRREDADWLEKNYAAVVAEVCAVLGESLAEIEQNALRADSKCRYQELAGSGTVTLVYRIASKDAIRHILIRDCVKSAKQSGRGDSQWEQLSLLQFTLMLWVAPATATGALSELLIDG